MNYFKCAFILFLSVACIFKGTSLAKATPYAKTGPLSHSLLDISPPRLDYECGNSKPLLLPPEIKKTRSYINGTKWIHLNTASGHLHNDSTKDSIDVRGVAVGGKPARFQVTKYMALLGLKKTSKIKWFCDGVLINLQWVLTAAHCVNRRTPNIIRLGEYDYNSRTDGSRVLDLKISKIYLHPQYRPPQGYNDLALLRLRRPVHVNNLWMNPVCLPWGNRYHMLTKDMPVTLTGWGATRYGGEGSSILQEVNMTVMDVSICDLSYSFLPDYLQKWPQGISDQDIICATDSTGTKDACQGDSGGPIVHLDKRNRFSLVGIVSQGFGCGHPQFPGLYMSMFNGNYLSWIKAVAF